MEALIIILVALVLCLKNAQEEQYEEEVLTDRETRLNPSFYCDENAFMEVADALGFSTDHSDANTSDGSVWN